MSGSTIPPPLPDAGERGLVARAQQGELAAFKELYTDHVPGVYHLCLRLAGEEAAAELAYEAFTDAWDRLAEIPADSGFGPWIHEITEKLARSQRRRFSLPTDDAKLEAAVAVDPVKRDSNDTALRRSLWPPIQGKIETDDVPPVERARLRRRQRRKGITRWSIVAAIVLSIVYYFPRSSSDSQDASALDAPAAPVAEDSASSPGEPETVDEQQVMDEEYVQAKDELLEAWEAQKESTDPELVESVDESMGVVETAIGEIISAMNDDPDNEVLKKMLVSTYRNQLSMLRGAIHQDD